MEPLSISTACLGLINGILALSKEVYAFSSGVRGARTAMKRVSTELDSLRLCLVALEEESATADYPENISNGILSIIKNCENVAAEMHSLLRSLSGGKLLRSVQWVAGSEDKVNTLRFSLEAHKSALELALQIGTTQLITSLRTTTLEIKHDTELIRHVPSQIGRLTEQIEMLRLQINRADASGIAISIPLQRFLDESTTYAESVIEYGTSVAGDNPFDDAGILDNETVSSPMLAGVESHNSSQETIHDAIDGAGRDILAAFDVGADDASIPDDETVSSPMLARAESNNSAQETTRDAINEADEDTLAALNVVIDHAAIEQSKKSRIQLSVEERDHIDQHLRNIVREKAPLSNVQLQEISQLIARGADVNAKDGDGWTLLHLAAYGGYLGVVKALLATGASVNVANEDGYSPLHLASQWGHLEIVKALLVAGASIDVAGSGGYTPLNLASYNGHLEIVKALLAAGASVDTTDKNGWTALHHACEKGDLETVKVLLAAGASVNVASLQGATPLHYACQKGNPEIVKVLLAAGASVNVASLQGTTPLHHACKEGNLETVKVLLAAGASVNVPGSNIYNPLLLASRGGHFEVMKALLGAGASVNGADKHGWTSLHHASFNRGLDVVKLLVEHGAQVDGKTIEGATALDLARSHKYSDVVKYLEFQEQKSRELVRWRAYKSRKEAYHTADTER